MILQQRRFNSRSTDIINRTVGYTSNVTEKKKVYLFVSLIILVFPWIGCNFFVLDLKKGISVFAFSVLK